MNNHIITRSINSKEEAEQFAKDWQNWSATQNLSYSELVEWQVVFEKLATKFKLSDTFKENGII